VAKEINTKKKIPGGLGAVDCTAEKELCTEQEVKRYPSCEYITSCHAQISTVTRE